MGGGGTPKFGVDVEGYTAHNNSCFPIFLIFFNRCSEIDYEAF